jgi:hypothetical protein
MEEFDSGVFGERTLPNMKRAATLQLQPFDIKKIIKLIKAVGKNCPPPDSYLTN